MDIKTLLKKLDKKLDISWVTVAWYALFSPEKLYEIALDKANTAVNLLLEANADMVQAVREKLAVLNGFLKKYRVLLPEAWEGYITACNSAAKDVYDATGDNRIDADERAKIIDRFRIAYSAFKAD